MIKYNYGPESRCQDTFLRRLFVVHEENEAGGREKVFKLVTELVVVNDNDMMNY